MDLLLHTNVGRNLLPTETVWTVGGGPAVGTPYWCKYYGVKCNEANDVIDVNLESFQMEGYLPDQIGNLNSLTSFTVGYNYVFGTIPSSIASWTQISYMNFFGNFLTGTIPSVISGLKTLQDLELDQNYLNGTIPEFLFELTKLKVLHLYDNSFSGTIPSNIGNLQMLTRLTLDTNGLRGTIPQSIATMRRLQYLHLFNNQLEGTIPSSISKLTDLYDISIYDNYFTGTLPYLADLTDLFILDVHTNFLTMGGLSELPESDFSWLTIQGPMDLSGNCLALPVKGFVATGCKPSVAPTTGKTTIVIIIIVVDWDGDSLSSWLLWTDIHIILLSFYKHIIIPRSDLTLAWNINIFNMSTIPNRERHQRPICSYVNHFFRHSYPSPPSPFSPIPQLHPHSLQVALLTSPHRCPPHPPTSQQTCQQRQLTNQHRTQHTLYSPQACLHGPQRLLLPTYLRYVPQSVLAVLPILSLDPIHSSWIHFLLSTSLQRFFSTILDIFW